MQKVSSIPNYFNDFLDKNQHLMKNEDIFYYNCNILMQLSRWLNFKGYSNLKIEYNDQVEVKVESEVTMMGQL